MVADLAGLHHVALSVKDLDISARWYQEVLGLEEEIRLGSEDRRLVVLRLLSSRQQVGLVEHKQSSGGFRPQNLGLDHLAFTVEDRDELERWADRLDQRGVATSGVVETPFGAMLHFTDPDGIALALFWNR